MAKKSKAKMNSPKAQKQKADNTAHTAPGHKDRLTRIHAMLDGCEKSKQNHDSGLHNKLIDIELKLSTLSEVVKNLERESEASRKNMLADYQKEGKEWKQAMGKRLDEGDAQIKSLAKKIDCLGEELAGALEGISKAKHEAESSRSKMLADYQKEAKELKQGMDKRIDEGDARIKMLAKKMDGVSNDVERARDGISGEAEKRKADVDKMLSRYKEMNKEINSAERGAKEKFDGLTERVSLAEVRISQGITGELTEETRELDAALRDLQHASELADKNMIPDAGMLYNRALAIYMKNVAIDSKNPIDRINLIELYGNLKHMQIRLKGAGMQEAARKEIRPVE